MILKEFSVLAFATMTGKHILCESLEKLGSFLHDRC